MVTTNTMLTRILTSFFVLLGFCAQGQNNKTIEFTSSSSDLENLRNELYLNPQFVDGVVYFKNGRSGKSKMNYYYLTNEIFFIGPKHDTLALTNQPEIDMVCINNDTFYYNGNQFIKQERNYGWIKIASFKTLKGVNRKMTGGYGETIDGAANSLSSVRVSNMFLELKPSEKVILKKEIKYYIGNESNGFLLLNKNNLFKLMPAQMQTAAHRFLKENSVDFTKPLEVDRFLTAISNQLEN